MTKATQPSRSTPSTATMAAAVVAAPGVVRIDQVPAPEPGPGAVRVRLEGCGVCASNVPPWEGRAWFEYPFAPGALGHEGWGRVDAVGPGVQDLAPGDRVALLSEHAYAACDVAPAEAVVRLPAALDARPFPGEPLGCAMNIFRRSQIEPGQTVAVVGIGFLGALLTRLAQQAGARVLALTRRPDALAIAAAMGAAETVAMDDHARVLERVGQLTRGRLCDVVIEATGKPWPLDLAGLITRQRGRLVVAGYHQDGPRQIDMRLWNWQGLDVINAHERDPAVYRAGIEAAVEAVVAGRLDPAPLYTHTLPLSRLSEALDLARDRPAGFMKALVTMDTTEG